MRWPALAALVLLACGRPEHAPAPARDRARLAVLPAIGLSIELPAGSAVYPRSGSWVLDLHPGRRQPMQIAMGAADTAPLERPTDDSEACPWRGPSTRQLGQGSWISFYTSTGCGGSGGEEARLSGRWTLRGRELDVDCVVQDEPLLSRGPDPAFCLPLLVAARPIPVSDGPAVLGPELSGENPLLRLPQEIAPAPSE